jgi:anti-sigma-K factor RskA
MTPFDHTKIEELLASKALDGLDPGELAELERERVTHGPDCGECRQLEHSYQEVAGRLAFAVASEPVRSQILEQILGYAGTQRSIRERRTARWRRSAAAIVAAAALVVAGGVGGYLLKGGPVAPHAVRLSSVGNPGTLAFVYQPGARSAYLVGSGLAGLPANQVYELWVMRGKTAVAAGTFDESKVLLPVVVDLAGATQVAVTVERAPGSRAPTSRPMFRAPISA